MKWVIGLAAAICLVPVVHGKEKAVGEEERYKVPVNAAFYPQNTPEKTMASIAKALNENDLSYLMGQLADPKYVDARVKELKLRYEKGTNEERDLVAFDDLVKEVAKHFNDDPTLIRELRYFAKDGKWDPATSSFSLEDFPSRRVFLKQIGERWFLENRQQ
jgi:hypothetical protein